MNRKLAVCALVLCALAAIGQDERQKGNPAGSAPIYRVTVVERTTPAINYQYRSGPTTIDFRGTVLLPQAKGSATVESRQGRTEVDARFERLAAPARFGREYLTYVLWALTPDGRPHNLGEVVANASDKANLRVTTDLQAFALIVTAEPYSAVRNPTDVVVLENAVRQDTVGSIQQVQANYALLPRGQYTWNVPADLESSVAKGPKVSMPEYEMLLELYQAQNAVGIARAANAERYAPNTLAKAQQLLDEAQQLQHSKADRHRVIQNARQAAETAEDARLIAERRKQEDAVSNARDEVSRAQQETARAEDEARLAKSQAQSAQAQADAERAARQRAEAEASEARQKAAHAEARLDSVQANLAPSVAVVVRPPQQQDAARKLALRVRLLEELNGTFTTRDTPRGLVVTIPDSRFRGDLLPAETSASLARISAAVVAHPGLRIEVEGYTDNESARGGATKRAEDVRDALVSRGLSSSAVSARGMGAERPLVSNGSPGGREQNRRVEIVISGEPIGDLASWDRTYSLTSR